MFVGLLVGFLFSSQIVLAEMSVTPFIPKGEYQFTDQIELLTAIEYVNVSSLNEAGRARIEQLKSRGYSCRKAQNRWFQCRRAGHVTALPTQVRANAMALNQNMRLIFSAAGGVPELETNGDIYKDWSTTETVTFGTRIFSGYITRLVHGRFQIVIGGMGEAADLTFLVNEHSLLRFYEQTVHSKDGWIRYSTAAVYQSWPVNYNLSSLYM